MSMLDTDGGTVPAEAEPTPPDPRPPTPENLGTPARRVADLLVVVGSAAFVLWQLHPDLILADTTPAGGDMGAHVWAFAELRDNLLPAGRLSGWTPDWYAGFPVFQFYMVVPFLAMVLLNLGVGGAAALVPFAGSLLLSARAAGASVRDRVVLGAVAAATTVIGAIGVWDRFGATTRAIAIGAALVAAGSAAGLGHGSRRRRFVVGAVLVALAGIAIPYGPAFKLVTVAGVVAMPATAYLFGRLCRFPFPTPALLSVATLAFLFDTSFTIYGGNIASTMAGEFAFSISLALALAYLGVLVHGLRTGTHRATAAVLLALVGLCHLIPAFFALGATAVILLVHVVAEAGARRRSSGVVPAEFGPPAVHRVGWLASTGAVSGLLAAWWVLPFFWRRTYLNDMGWEKIAVRDPGEDVWTWLRDDVAASLIPADLRLWAALALVGAVLSVAFRNRMGSALVLLGGGLAVAFVVVPQGRLWNARLLPFWYLVVYLLAAIAVGEVVRSLAAVLATDPRRPRTRAVTLAAPVALLLLATFLGGQLRNLPGGGPNDDGTYRLVRSVGIPGLVSFRVPDALGIDVSGRNFVTDWSRWNYSGYERKAAYPEYRSIVATMDELGAVNGCGRAMWEYRSDLNDYGTPMALMLLPHWTDGCIGSMEGLYFEASSTTPFHFLVQSELSQAPSRAQRDMPYRDLDVDAGVEHLQLLGVRYYLARSPEAVTAARAHPDLTELAASGPWVVFEVDGAALVEALPAEPAVTTGGEAQHDWLCGAEDDFGRCVGHAVEWFQDPSRWDVALAATGPAAWQRVDPGERPETRPVAPAVVSDIVEGRSSISFRVDRPGTPVLVKSSYFPNWQADGADGPYRVAPNLMVVVPTDTEVTLRFGRTGIDLLAGGLSILGVVALVALARRPRIAVVALPRD